MDDRISIDGNEALDALVERAGKSGEVVLTKAGSIVARLVPAPPPPDREEAHAALDNILRIGSKISLAGYRFKDLINEGRKH